LRALARRRRNLRKPSAPKAHAAAASTAGTCIEVIVDWVELARPTRITPVLVTGPLSAVTAAAAEEAGVEEAAAEEAGAVAAGVEAAAEGLGLCEPLSMPSPPIVVAGAAYVCDEPVLGLAGAVAGVVGAEDSVTVRVPETVMVTDGLPGPQAALTVYGPEADWEIVADPLKLICVFENDAEPPTKAEE
jgi:hypothetical protein